MEPNPNRPLIIGLVVAAGAVILTLCMCSVIGGIAAVIIAQQSYTAANVELAPVVPQPLPQAEPEMPPTPELPEVAPAETPERPVAPSATQAPQGIGAGAYVREVVSGGPADQAGLRVGDIVVFVDQQSLLGTQRLVDVIADYKPGDKVLLGVVRAEMPLTVEVTLGEHPDDASQPYLGVRYVDLVNGDAPPNGD
jgi:S1-C subfamily serine protease